MTTINRKFNSTVRQVGGSKMITIHKELSEELKIREGEEFEFAILKKNFSETTKSYICIACNHYFSSNDIIPYCPVCESEKLKEVDCFNEKD